MSSKRSLTTLAIVAAVALLTAATLIVDFHDLQVALGFGYRQLIAVLLVISVLLVIKAYYDAMRIDKDILSFRIVSQFILLSYSVVAPLAVLVFDYDRKRIGYYLYKDFDYQRVAEVLFWFVLMQIGMLIGSRIETLELKLRNVVFPSRTLLILGWTLFLLSLSPFIVLAAGGNLQADTDYINTFVVLREQSQAAKALFYLGFFLIFPMFCVLVTAVAMERYKHAMVMMGIIVVITVFKPSRGLLFTAILAVLFAYHYLIRNLKIKHGIIALVVLALLSVVLVDRRAGESASRDRIDALIKIGEGSVVFENTYIIAKYLEDTSDYRWGQTYLTALVNIAPQWVLPFKKEESLIMWFRNTFFGAVTERTSGRMFSIIAEAYMNFKLMGPLLLGALYSYFLKMLYVEMSLQKDRGAISLAMLLYFYFCSTMYYFIRGDLSSFLIRTETYVMLPLIVLLLFRKRAKITYHGTAPQ